MSEKLCFILWDGVPGETWVEGVYSTWEQVTEAARLHHEFDNSSSHGWEPSEHNPSLRRSLTVACDGMMELDREDEFSEPRSCRVHITATWFDQPPRPQAFYEARSRAAELLEGTLRDDALDAWFDMPLRLLGGATPYDALVEGRYDDVVGAAESVAEGGYT